MLCDSDPCSQGKDSSFSFNGTMQYQPILRLVHFQSHFQIVILHCWTFRLTLSRITLIATLARVSRVVLEYSSSEPYDSPLYAPGVIDASSSPRFPRVVPHLPPAQSVFSQPLIAGPPALFWPFWAELCRPVSMMTKTFQRVGLSPVHAINAGFDDSAWALAPLTLLHTNPTSHQSVALELLMQGLTPRDNGVLVVENFSIS
jgi:hypothetical protein